MTKKSLKQVRTLIADLGEGFVVADAINSVLPRGIGKIKPDSVWKMKQTGIVPYKWRVYLARVAVAQNKRLPSILQEYAPFAETPNKEVSR